MAYTYTYNITDFPEQKVTISRLAFEITESSIVMPLVGINSTPTTVDIIFENQLTSPDETTLNSVISTHDADGALPPEPLNLIFRLWKRVVLMILHLGHQYQHHYQALQKIMVQHKFRCWAVKVRTYRM